MSKINEYFVKKSRTYDETGAVYFCGVNDCMDLRIGEKFAEWMDRNVQKLYNDKYTINFNQSFEYTLPELYDYFLENIFQP